MIVDVAGAGRYRYVEEISGDSAVRHRWGRGVRLLEEVAEELESSAETRGEDSEARPARSVSTEPLEAVRVSRILHENDNSPQCRSRQVER